MIGNYLHHGPRIHEEAYIAPTADVVGRVTIHKDASVWHGAVIRGDVNEVVIGERTNVQDLTVIHEADDYGVFIGSDVTIGHGAIVHACTIENNCLIGMGAIILDGAHIEENVIIGAGALVTGGKRIPRNSMVLGSPGKVVRSLTEEEIKELTDSALKYVRVSKEYAQEGVQTNRGK